MLSSWDSILRVHQDQLWLLVRQGPQADVLKARLPSRPRHPRALLTLLEGLALWNGHRLHAVLDVDEPCDNSVHAVLFGDGLYPTESQLVRFELGSRTHRRRVAGVGNFESLRSVAALRYEP